MADNLTTTTTVATIPDATIVATRVVTHAGDANSNFQGIFPVYLSGSEGSYTINEVYHLEDTAHTSGDAGQMPLAVRNDTLAALAGTDGDYAPFQVDALGAVFVTGPYKEDSAHSSGDYGMMSLAVHRDADTAIAGTNGDYSPLLLDTRGFLKVEAFPPEAGLPVTNAGTFAVQVDGDALTALQLIDNVVYVDDADWTDGTSSHALVGGLYQSTPQTITDGDVGPLQVNSNGVLMVDVAAQQLTNQEIGTVDTVTSVTAVVDITGGVVPGTAATDLGKAEDAAHSSGDTGVYALAVRDDVLGVHSGADGDYESLHTTERGALWNTNHANPEGGCKYFSSKDIDETEEDVATSQCTVYSMYFWNATAAPLWAQIFNTNTVTVGTTAPIMNFIIPANADSDGAGVVIPIPACGLEFTTALTVAVTIGVGINAGAPGANAAGCIICYED